GAVVDLDSLFVTHQKRFIAGRAFHRRVSLVGYRWMGEVVKGAASRMLLPDGLPLQYQRRRRGGWYSAQFKKRSTCPGFISKIRPYSDTAISVTRPEINRQCERCC